MISILCTYIYLDKKETSKKNALEKEDDFVIKSYLHDFESYRYDKSGQLKEIINSKTALDIPTANEIRFTKPSIQTHDGNSNSWVASADLGIMQKASSLLTLKNNVSILNKQTGSKVQTSEINFNLLSRIASTEKNIVMLHDDGLTRATGMMVDLKKSNLKLLAEVRTIYSAKND